jgi:hypothetical protein
VKFLPIYSANPVSSINDLVRGEAPSSVTKLGKKENNSWVKSSEKK